MTAHRPGPDGSRPTAMSATNAGDTRSDSDHATDPATAAGLGAMPAQMIPGLIQPAMSALTSLPQMAMGAPQSFLGMAQPLLSSMLGLLGQGGQNLPHGVPRTTMRPANAVTGSTGRGIDAYREAAHHAATKEGTVHTRDDAVNSLVERGDSVQAQAHNRIYQIAAQLNQAIQRTPPGPEGQAFLNATIRNSLAAARDVVTDAQSEYSQIAAAFQML
ncbi:hypothetical protein JF729_27370 [Mycobacterium intracellulare]|uniref:hypothetical protein n=1 Tax=Mycobacterium intracellulare TaxID=1767 RepID=UPI001CDA3CE0|nr:hypothetical protein [Mycobacterium intracellulare]MCA2251507.1 hypothetical protein [Mycobacterium intracellulare]